jgi:hypothetical protein
MEVTYQLTEDDFRHGMIAWRMSSKWRRWNYWFGLAVMVPILILCTTLLIVRPHSEFREIQARSHRSAPVKWHRQRLFG